MINACSSFNISFTGYRSTMVDTVKKAVKEQKAAIHCAYSGDLFTNSKKHRPSIEHIKPHTDGGADKDFNFLPVIREINSERGHIPLPEYVKNHPETIENVKRTILEVARLKSAKFDGKKWAQEVIQTFSKESKINLDIDLNQVKSTIYIEDAVKKPKIKPEKIETEFKTQFQKQLEEILKKLEPPNQ